MSLLRRVAAWRLSKELGTTAVQIVGFAAISVGGFQVNVTVGWFVTGAVLVFVGHAVG